MDLLANIKRRAEKTGQTVEDVEKKAELSPRTIRRWNDHAPAFDKVARVANVLGCTVDDLIRDDPAEAPGGADEPEAQYFRSVAN